MLVLRLVHPRTGAHFVEYDGDEPPDSVLVQIPSHRIIGERYRLEWPQTRSYRFVENELLPMTLLPRPDARLAEMRAAGRDEGLMP